jgi:hypothetical protein
MLETMMVGYRRAAVFMGLGCNAARRADFVDYNLDHATNFRLLPESVDAGTLNQWKEEFYQWTVSGGLREVVEYTSVFLDQVYEAISIMVDHKHDPKKLRRFHLGGLKDKVDRLASQYGISCRCPEAFASVGPLRNCFIHRLGIVGQMDAGAAGALTLTWFGFKMTFCGNDGTEYPGPDITDPAALPWTAPCEGMLAARFQLFEKMFAVGTKVILTPHTLNQVLWSMQLMAQDYINALTERARKEGILKEKT